jgi:hypothetical protein
MAKLPKHVSLDPDISEAVIQATKDGKFVCSIVVNKALREDETIKRYLKK